MTLAEVVRDIRHRLAELVAEHGRWDDDIDGEVNQLITQALSTELAAAHRRERVVAEAYERQQTAQRELEALYQAMTARMQAAEARIAAALAILDEMGRSNTGANLLRDVLTGAEQEATRART